MAILRLAILAAATVFATQAARGGTIASAPVYGGGAQSSFICYMFNSGSAAATLKNLEIIDQSGTSLTLTNNTCGTSLPAASECAYTANATQGAHVCLATIPGSTALIRGTAAARGPGDLASTDIH